MMFILKLLERLSFVRDVTYVTAGCLVVQQFSDDRSRSTFGSPLFLYIAISLAVKCQEIYTNVKNVKLNGVVMNFFSLQCLSDS
jgi:hypothetical protein